MHERSESWKKCALIRLSLKKNIHFWQACKQFKTLRVAKHKLSSFGNYSKMLLPYPFSLGSILQEWKWKLLVTFWGKFVLMCYFKLSRGISWLRTDCKLISLIKASFYKCNCADISNTRNKWLLDWQIRILAFLKKHFFGKLEQFKTKHKSNRRLSSELWMLIL